MAGRPTERNLRQTVLRIDEMFRDGKSQIEVTLDLGFTKIDSLRSYLWRNGTNFKDIKNQKYLYKIDQLK